MTNHRKLRPEQLRAIHYMSQPGNGGCTVEDIAHECGVSRQTLNRWTHHPEFKAELSRQTALNALANLPESIEVLIGDTPNSRDTITAAKGMATSLTKLIDSLREEPEYIGY